MAPDEVIARLDRIRTEASSGLLSHSQERALADRIEGLIRACPDGAHWDRLPAVGFALGQAYAELGSAYFDQARESYLASIGAEDTQGRAPIRAIEQLANLEARRGDGTADVAMVHTALARLRDLVRAAAKPPRPDAVRSGAGQEGASDATSNPERAALIGSACKRLAAAHARALIQGAAGASPEGFRQALNDGIDAYSRVEGIPAEGTLNPYHALNRLALEAVLNVARAGAAADPGAHVALAGACAQAARDKYLAAPDVWNAVAPADAALTGTLLDGSLGLEGEPGDGALEATRKVYDQALAHVRATPRELDSVAKQICLLALFYRAWEAILVAGRRAAAGRFATRLEDLADHIVPGACKPPTKDAPAQPPPDTEPRVRRRPRRKGAAPARSRR